MGINWPLSMWKAFSSIEDLVKIRVGCSFFGYVHNPKRKNFTIREHKSSARSESLVLTVLLLSLAFINPCLPIQKFCRAPLDVLTGLKFTETRKRLPLAFHD